MSAAHVPGFAQGHPEGTVLLVLAAPRSSANAVGPVVDDVVRVRVTAAAADGAANAAIIRLLSDALAIPKSRVRIISGHSAKRKRILIEGLRPTDVVTRLSARMTL